MGYKTRSVYAGGMCFTTCKCAPCRRRNEWIEEAAQIYIDKCGWSREEAMKYAASLAEDDHVAGQSILSYYSEDYSAADAVHEDMSYWD